MPGERGFSPSPSGGSSRSREDIGVLLTDLGLRILSGDLSIVVIELEDLYVVLVILIVVDTLEVEGVAEDAHLVAVAGAGVPW